MHPLGIALGFAPAFVWLGFYLQEDPRPEPKRLLAFTFILGGISTMLALVVQIYMRNSGFLGSLSPDMMIGASAFLPLTLLALTEEIVKFGAAYFAVRKAKDFDEPVDAMIYAIVAALGFATVENIAVLQGQFSDQALISSIIGLTTARFIGATLLHTLTAAFMGYYWAISIREGGRGRYIIMGLIVATILHAGFNFLIINYDGLIYPLILLIFGGFFALEDFEELKAKR